MTKVPRARTRVVRRVATVLLGTVVLLGLVVVLGGYVADELLSCSPPGERAQAVQEELVRARLPDATGLDWYVAGCDDNGTGFLRFHTALSPAAAQAAFVDGGDCRPIDQSELDTDVDGVECESGSATVTVLLEAAAKGGTDAELALP